MTDVHFLTASLSLFEKETESERLRQSTRKKNKEGECNKRDEERKQTSFCGLGRFL